MHWSPLVSSSSTRTVEGQGCVCDKENKKIVACSARPEFSRLIGYQRTRCQLRADAAHHSRKAGWRSIAHPRVYFHRPLELKPVRFVRAPKEQAEFFFLLWRTQLTGSARILVVRLKRRICPVVLRSIVREHLSDAIDDVIGLALREGEQLEFNLRSEGRMQG